MHKKTLSRIFICIAVAAFCFYSHIDRQNYLTQLQMDIPIIARQLKALEEENNRLQLAIDVAESPARLFAALQKAEYGHLKHPSKNEVITLAKGFVAPKKKQVEKEQKFLPLGGGSVVGARR